MSVLHLFVRQVDRRLRRLGVGREGIVVAVSGGPDSVALARAILTLYPTGGVVLAHLNHQLRGDESDADEEFVKQLHATLAVPTPLYCQRVAVAELARRERDNLEAVARRVRYEWLARIAAEAGARWIATGHTADDQAETVLHRLLRGTGLKGLRGIAARRRLNEQTEIIRPMLGIRRADVLAYLDAIGQPYRIDSSNRDRRYLRNRIRHELLPVLAVNFNPEIVAILGRLAEQANDAYAIQERQARALLATAERPRAGSLLVFDRAALADAPRLVVREMFRLLWEREGWPTGRMDFDAWDRLAELAAGARGGIDLPGGIRANGRERVVQIESCP